MVDNNKISKIANELFEGNSCPLKAFFIKENNMDSINGKFLQNCTQLRFLFVSENNLKKIPSNLLKDKPVLKTFDASRLHIREMNFIFKNHSEIRSILSMIHCFPRLHSSKISTSTRTRSKSSPRRSSRIKILKSLTCIKIKSKICQ